MIRTLLSFVRCRQLNVSSVGSALRLVDLAQHVSRSSQNCSRARGFDLDSDRRPCAASSDAELTRTASTDASSVAERSNQDLLPSCGSSGRLPVELLRLVLKSWDLPRVETLDFENKLEDVAATKNYMLVNSMWHQVARPLLARSLVVSSSASAGRVSRAIADGLLEPSAVQFLTLRNNFEGHWFMADTLDEQARAAVDGEIRELIGRFQDLQGLACDKCVLLPESLTQLPPSLRAIYIPQLQRSLNEGEQFGALLSALPITELTIASSYRLAISDAAGARLTTLHLGQRTDGRFVDHDHSMFDLGDYVFPSLGMPNLVELLLIGKYGDEQKLRTAFGERGQLAPSLRVLTLGFRRPRIDWRALADHLPPSLRHIELDISLASTHDRYPANSCDLCVALKRVVETLELEDFDERFPDLYQLVIVPGFKTNAYVFKPHGDENGWCKAIKAACERLQGALCSC